MEKKKVDRSVKFKVSPLHTFLINQHVQICQKIKVNLVAGSAEIFGLQLKKNYPHQYWVPCSLPVFTWEGAEIQVEWIEDENTKNTQKSWTDITVGESQTPMIKYLQIFYQLFGLRKVALEEVKEGPKIAIVGSQTSGIQNISKILLNYSGKYNMNPMFVDLDPESSSIFVEGSMGVMSFQYRVCEDLFDRPDKLCFYYGNRRTIQKSYAKMVKMLKDAIRRKNSKQIKIYKEKGSDEQYPEFSSGLIIQCPRIKQKFDKEEQLKTIQQIVRIFDISHLIIIENSEADYYFNKQAFQNITKYKTKIPEGTSQFITLPRPIRSKIQRYFDKESKKKTYEIKDIRLFQIIQSSQEKAYLRTINIQQEAISKNTIAIMHSEYDQTFSKQQLAVKAMQSSICCLAHIFGIESEKGEIVLEIAHDNFLEEFGNKIWLTSVSDQ